MVYPFVSNNNLVPIKIRGEVHCLHSSISFIWYMYFFLYNTIFFLLLQFYSLKSGSVIPSAFVLSKDYFGYLVSFLVPYKFQDCFFYFCELFHQDFNRDCFESIHYRLKQHSDIQFSHSACFCLCHSVVYFHMFSCSLLPSFQFSLKSFQYFLQGRFSGGELPQLLFAWESLIFPSYLEDNFAE